MKQVKRTVEINNIESKMCNITVIYNKEQQNG